MKKFISIALAILAMGALLVSCGTEDADDKGSETADTTVNLPTAADNYDENGKFILESGENRKVYPTENGYVVFCFLGDAVQNIFEVRTFADNESAKAYADSCVKEQGANRSSVKVEDDKVIVTVGFSMEEKGYGKYYTMTRDQVIAEFDSKEEDVEWITQ